MKSDYEVLSEAIEILEGEGNWCQGAYVRRDESGHLSFCAEGAILRAVGYSVTESRLIGDPALVANGEQRRSILEQGWRLRELVAKALPGNPGLPRNYNDREDASKEEIILAMKKVREAL